MGIPVGSAVEQSNAAQIARGSLVAAFPTEGGVSPAFTPTKPYFNIELAGTFVATVVVDRSFDGGITWVSCTSLGTLISFSGQVSETLKNFEPGVSYRFRCTAYTSGTVLTRMSE